MKSSRVAQNQIFLNLALNRPEKVLHDVDTLPSVMGMTCCVAWEQTRD
jgi:hypothetical protein